MVSSFGALSLGHRCVPCEAEPNERSAVGFGRLPLPILQPGARRPWRTTDPQSKLLSKRLQLPLLLLFMA
jgi:hypothetical protein